MAVNDVSESDAAAFLERYHGMPVTELVLLRGGFWSVAYGYTVNGRQLVVRFGQLREGFEMDRAAMAFERPGLPIPDVLDDLVRCGGFEVGGASRGHLCSPRSAGGGGWIVTLSLRPMGGAVVQHSRC